MGVGGCVWVCGCVGVCGEYTCVWKCLQENLHHIVHVVCEFVYVGGWEAVSA